MVNMDNNGIETGLFYSFLTGKAYTALSRRLQKNLRGAGLEVTAEQWSILYALWEEEGLTQQELAQRTFREKTAITRIIDNMERRNLLIRVPDKGDRRTNLIYLTKVGRQLKGVCMEQANQTLKEALAGVDAGHIHIAKDTLKKVYENLK